MLDVAKRERERERREREERERERERQWTFVEAESNFKQDKPRQSIEQKKCSQVESNSFF